MKHARALKSAALAIGITLIPAIANAANDCSAAGPTTVLCKGSKELETASGSLYAVAGYFFSVVRAPVDELQKLKTKFNHDHLNGLVSKLDTMNTNNAKLIQRLDAYTNTSGDKQQAAWDRVVEQARDTLSFVLPIITDLRSETTDVVNEVSFAELEKNMHLKAEVLINFPQAAPQQNDPWLVDFNKQFKNYAKALDAASEALAEFNKKLTET